MSNRVKFSREALLDAAIALTRKGGIEAINARNLAKEAGCSTQPLFSAFRNMEEIKQAVMEKAMEIYNAYVLAHIESKETAYKDIGAAYIRFAREETQLFKLIYMRSAQTPSMASLDDQWDYVLDAIVDCTGYERKKALRFHHRLWIFTHGLATMVATRYIDFSDTQIDHFLGEEYMAMKALYDQEA